MLKSISLVRPCAQELVKNAAPTLPSPQRPVVAPASLMPLQQQQQQPPAASVPLDGSSGAAAPNSGAEADPGAPVALTASASTPAITHGVEGLLGLSSYGGSQEEEEVEPDVGPSSSCSSSLDGRGADAGADGPATASASSGQPPPWRVAAPIGPAAAPLSAPIGASAAPCLRPPITPADRPPASPEPCTPGEELVTSGGAPSPASASAAAVASAAAPPSAGDGEEEDPGLPPDEVRTVIDKLAAFVARNGRRFEATVRERERANPKFAFLLPWSPHHDYYRRQLEERGVKEPEAKQEASTTAALGPSTLQPEAKQQASTTAALGLSALQPSHPAFGPAVAPPPEAPQGAPLVGPQLPQPQELPQAHQPDSAASSLREAVRAAVTAIKANPRFHVAAAVPTVQLPAPAFATAAASSAAVAAAATLAVAFAAAPSAAPPAAQQHDEQLGSNAATCDACSPAPEPSPASQSLPAVPVSAPSPALSTEQLLLQRRQRARALLLQKQADAKRREDEARRAAISGHRRALQGLLANSDEEGQGEEDSEEAGQLPPPSWPPLLPENRLDLIPAGCAAETAEDQAVSNDPLPSMASNNLADPAGIMLTPQTDGSVEPPPPAVSVAASSQSLPPPIAVSVSVPQGQIAARTQGEEAVDGSDGRRAHGKKKSKRERHGRNRSRSRSRSRDDRHRRASKQKKRKQHRKRSRSSSSSSSPDRSRDKHKARRSSRAEEPRPTPVPISVMQEPGTEAAGEAASGAPSVDDQGGADLRLRVRQMLLGLNK